MDLMQTAQLLGNFGEFFGAIAVVATLFYLSVQIRQNSRATQMSNSHELNEATRAWWAKLSDHNGLASIWRRGLMDLSSLTPEETLRFSTMMQQMMNLMEELHYAESSDEITGWVGASLKTGAPEIMALPGFKSWFEQRGHWLAPEFRAIVESMMSDEPLPTASWYQEHSGS